MQPQTRKALCVAFAVLGAAVLVLKGHYTGVGEQLVRSYAGNVSVSFALYFAAVLSFDRQRHRRLLAALTVFFAVTAFELTNGFGVMLNVFDPFDVLANALGVGLAVLIDVASSHLLSSRGERRAGGHPTSAST